MESVAVTASFALGQIVRHRDLGYRGVVYDVDPVYQGSEEWYQRHVDEPQSDREAPWYYVIVDEGETETYVPEQNLEADESGEPVWHPEIEDLFLDFCNGAYVPRQLTN